jgi:hypothetical protein
MDNKDEESEEEDHNQNEDQSRKTNAIRNLGRGKFPPWIKKVLEFLFRLIIAFYIKEVIDNCLDLILLVYYSSIFRFLANLISFLLTRLYISNLTALIYI